jgi:uncharacterized protein
VAWATLNSLRTRNLLDVSFELVSPSGAQIARTLTWARTPIQRARGLLGRGDLHPGEGLILERAAQVHTFGMRYPIDVVFCDEDWRVRHVVRTMRPCRMSRWVRGATRVVETRGGELDSSVVPGRRLRLLTAPTPDRRSRS